MKKINVVLLLNIVCSVCAMEDFSDHDTSNLEHLGTPNTRAYEYLYDSENVSLLCGTTALLHQAVEVFPNSYQENDTRRKRRKEYDAIHCYTYKQYNCSLCFDTKFGSVNFKQDFRKHLSEEHGILTYNCYDFSCKEKFKKKRDMMDHLEKDHHDKFQCEKCPSDRTYGRQEIMDHYGKDHANFFYKCKVDNCTEEFVTDYDLFDHVVEKHHGIALFRGCGKVKKEAKLGVKRGNRATSIGECPKCKKKMRDFNSFRTHARCKHSVNTFFSCPLPRCCKRFKDIQSLVNHRGEHLATDYQCVLCKDEHKNFDAYKKHYSAKHGNRFYFCKFCPKAFEADNALFFHEMENHLEDIQQKTL